MKKILGILLALIPSIALAQAGGGCFDDPAGFYKSCAVLNNQVVIGSSKSPLGGLYVTNLHATSQTTTGNQTISGNLTVTGNSLVSGNSVTTGTDKATSFLLTDGSDKNHEISSAASGTGYHLTGTPATLALGTSTASVVIDKAGTYLLFARVNLEDVGATFAANRTVTLTMHRTNNTPADVTGGSTSFGTGIVTTASQLLFAGMLPVVPYVTTNTNDIIQIYGSVSVVPSAGNLDATEANIVAVRIF